jgi:hypothetical protein
MWVLLRIAATLLRLFGWDPGAGTHITLALLASPPPTTPSARTERPCEVVQAAVQAQGQKGAPAASWALGRGPRKPKLIDCRPGIKWEWEIVCKGHRLLHKTKTQKQRISSIPKKKIKPGGASASPDVPARGGQSPGPCFRAWAWVLQGGRASPLPAASSRPPWKDLAARGPTSPRSGTKKAGDGKQNLIHDVQQQQPGPLQLGGQQPGRWGLRFR